MEKPGKAWSRPRPLWRLLAASPLPFVVPVWALWRDVYMLDAAGVQRVGGPGEATEWALLTLASAGLVATFWARERTVRMTGYILHWLLTAVAFGAAGVLAVAHAFGGLGGDLAAPTWALVALSVVAAVCVVALLATAALIVEDGRAAGEEE